VTAGGGSPGGASLATRPRFYWGLRAKLFLMFALVVATCLVAVTALDTLALRHTFQALDAQRTTRLVEQFQREIVRQRREVAHHVAAVADSAVSQAMVLDLARPGSNPGAWVNAARDAAAEQQLEFLDYVASDGVIVSSAEWPAHFGYHWQGTLPTGEDDDAYLGEVSLQDATVPALLAARRLQAGDQALNVLGGRRLDRQFLASLVVPDGVRVLLYSSAGAGFDPGALTGAAGPLPGATPLARIVQRALVAPPAADASLVATVHWTSDPADSEVVHALPLRGRQGAVLGVLLLAGSRRELVQLEQSTRIWSLLAGGLGLLLSLPLSGLAAARVTRPVGRLASAALQVAAGDWNVQVERRGTDELAMLAEAFNRMTHELLEQREKLLQTERVAAWRELARRLAHELKNPLFPLQLTIENLARAGSRAQESPQHRAAFEEVVQETTATLLAELANLKTIIGRFGDFAKMPAPQVRRMQLNDTMREVAQLFRHQLESGQRRSGEEGAPITLQVDLDPQLPPVEADPDLMRRALENLVLNAIDAMPTGGRLTLHSYAGEHPGAVVVEVSDTGVGLTPEEAGRLFTPYYTTKRHGTGLGLALVQSIVSDHGATISVASREGQGTTFRIQFETG